MTKWTVRSLALTSFLATAGSFAAGDIIYQDNFDRTGASLPLNGQTPDQTSSQSGGTAGATWTAASWTTDGTKANLSTSNNQAFLPFAPVAGNVYALSADLNCTSTGGASGNWLSLGFSNTNSASGGQWQVLDPNTYGWLLERGVASTSNPDQAFAGPNTGGGVNISTTVSGFHLFTITLNTTQSTWTASVSIDGSAVGSTLNLPAAAVTGSGSAPIQFAGFGSGGGATSGIGNVSAFTLQTVPEPAPLALLGGIAVAELVRRRAPRVEHA